MEGTVICAKGRAARQNQTASGYLLCRRSDASSGANSGWVIHMVLAARAHALRGTGRPGTRASRDWPSWHTRFAPFWCLRLWPLPFHPTNEDPFAGTPE